MIKHRPVTVNETIINNHTVTLYADVQYVDVFYEQMSINVDGCELRLWSDNMHLDGVESTALCHDNVGMNCIGRHSVDVFVDDELINVNEARRLIERVHGL